MTNLPPDITPYMWAQYVHRLIQTGKQFPSCNGIPLQALNHMEALLLGDTGQDDRLDQVLLELKLLRSAHGVGAILSRQIVDVTEDGATPVRARKFDEIVNNAISLIEEPKS